MSEERNRANTRPLKLCRIVTVPFVLQTLLREQLEAVLLENIALSLVTSPGSGLDGLQLAGSYATYPIHMSRQISPRSDLRALIRLVRLFQWQRFDIVHSSTPKAGLLTALAGFLSRTPIRMHTYTGQVWVELQGWRRIVSNRSDWLIAQLDTQLYADSVSQMEFLIKQHISPPDKISVLGAGSIAGVNVERFSSERWGGACAVTTRGELGIGTDALVILFAGRITRDKGICELITAFNAIPEAIGPVELVLAGGLDQVREVLPQPVLRELAHNPRIHNIGFTSTPEKYMGIADIFCLPSYREGFGNVIIEAAAMGVPAVATNIVGVVDAIENGKTGILVPVKNSRALRDALCKLLQDSQCRARMGQAARQRAVKLFDARSINRLVIAEYRRAFSRMGQAVVTKP